MRSLFWLSCVLSLVGCAESRERPGGAAAESGSGLAGSAADGRAGRAAGAAAGGGTSGSGMGGAGGDAAAGGVGEPVDECAAHSNAVAAFVSANRACFSDFECAVVGSCSGGFGFQAVNGTATEAAQAMSDATPSACGTFDGPLYEAVCKGVSPETDYMGECALQEIGQSCGQAPEPSTICDGSSGIRLAFNAYGGYGLPGGGRFAIPYGSWFGVLDGKCHFYASQSVVRGIYAGVLSKEDAATLARDLRFDRLEQWKGRYGRSCLDGGSQELIVRSGAVVCACGCDGAPAGLATAMKQAKRWVDQLVTLGEPLDGDVSAVAYEFTGPDQSGALDWPLSRAIKDIAGLVTTDQIDPGPGAHFAAGQEAMLLRALRKAAMYPELIMTHDGTPAVAYYVYVRDNLSDADDKALRAFLNYPTTP